MEQDRKMLKRAVKPEAGKPIMEHEKSGKEGNMAALMPVGKH